MNGCMNTLTLQKMRYLVCIAETGSISGAAKVLYVSQPSLTKTIRDIEDELGFSIFERTGKGIIVTPRGEEFLGYARQILDRADLLQEKYLSPAAQRRQYCVSTLHYSFAVRAFNELVKSNPGEEYDFSIRETQLGEIIEDVATMKSALGVIYLNDANERVLRRTFNERELEYEKIGDVRPRILLSVHHPLAKHSSLTSEELKDYPFVSFEHREHDSFYLPEGLLNSVDCARHIKVRDRATLYDILLGADAYTISNGNILPELTGARIVSIPMENSPHAEIGVIYHHNRRLGRLSALYLKYLRRFIEA